MFYLKKLVSAIALPPFGLILLALLGLWLMRRHPRVGQYMVICSLLVLTAFSFPPVAGALMLSLKSQPPISADELARAQAIVILAGDDYPAAPEYGGDTVGQFTLERIRYGVYLQNRSGLPILVTGGAPYGGRPSAESMKETIERDFHGRVKWVENMSDDTAENATYSTPMLRAAGISRIAVVSNTWHLPRAAELFERQGLEVIPAPTGFPTYEASLFSQLLPSAAALENSRIALKEWLGILVQRYAINWNRRSG